MKPCLWGILAKKQLFLTHETVILVIFGPNLGHETSNFGQKFDIFLKKKKKFVETSSGFKKTCQKTEVVSKKVSFFKMPIENQVFERHILSFKIVIFYANFEK